MTRRVEMDHKARIAWVKHGNIALASFAFEAWGGANKAQMAAETYLSEGEESPWELRDRIAALEARVAAANKLAEALSLYSCEDGCNDCPEHKRDRVSCGWTARTALAAYQTTKEEKQKCHLFPTT